MFAVALMASRGWIVDRVQRGLNFHGTNHHFPKAKNDDMCDAMSQAACWLLQRPIETVTISNAFTGRTLFQYVG